MLITEFDYQLPKELIAQEPLKIRDESRLLVLDRKDGRIQETIFKRIGEYLKPGDVLVLNDTKVIPARLFGKISMDKSNHYAENKRVEILLLRERKEGIWETLTRPAKRFKPGTIIRFEKSQFLARVLEREDSGVRILEFIPPQIDQLLKNEGLIPFPPYIRQASQKFANRYQTVFAKRKGAVAAPTAGLHFTRELLQELKTKEIEIVFITLHSSLGTFRPVKAETVEEHKMYPEEFELSDESSAIINQKKSRGSRIIAVGTTVVRSLEASAYFEDSQWQVRPKKGMTDLYIYPGYEFKIVDGMITNFHLPKSTLLLLVCAFAKKEFIFNAYDFAIKNRFRFYSFGDAMLII